MRRKDSLQSETDSLLLRSKIPARVCRELPLGPTSRQAARGFRELRKGRIGEEFPAISLYIREVGPKARSVSTSHTARRRKGAEPQALPLFCVWGRGIADENPSFDKFAARICTAEGCPQGEGPYPAPSESLPLPWHMSGFAGAPVGARRVSPG